MTKKQFLNWVENIPANATLDDIGFAGVPYASKEEVDRIIKNTEAEVRQFMENDKKLREKQLKNQQAV